MHAGRQRPAVGRERLDDLARRDRQHRPQPQHLLDGRVEVRVVAVAQPRGHARVAREPLERPGERAGGRLVPGGEQRHDLVAQLVLGRAGGDQLVDHGRCRGAGRGARGSPPAAARRRARPRARTAPRRRAARRERERDQARQRRRHVERLADRRAQLRVGRAEHDAQDHVERQLLHPRQRAQRPAGLPAVELGGSPAPRRSRGAPPSARRGTAAASAAAGAGAPRRSRAGSSSRRRTARARSSSRRPAATPAARRRRA